MELESSTTDSLYYDQYTPQTLLETIKMASVGTRVDMLIYLLARHDPIYVNWTNVQNIITDDVEPGDFNNFTLSKMPIESMGDLRALKNKIVHAELGKFPKYVSRCKECGEQFNLFTGQVNHFRKNNLMLPRRCPKCLEQKRAEYEADTKVG